MTGTLCSAIRLSSAVNSDAVRSVRADDEWRHGAGDILLWNINRDVARVGRGMAGGDDQFGGIGGIGRAEGSGLARDAGIDLAVCGIHGELDHRSLRHAGAGQSFPARAVRRTEDKVSIGIGRRDGAIGEFCGLDISRRRDRASVVWVEPAVRLPSVSADLTVEPKRIARRPRPLT